MKRVNPNSSIMRSYLRFLFCSAQRVTKEKYLPMLPNCRIIQVISATKTSSSGRFWTQQRIIMRMAERLITKGSTKSFQCSSQVLASSCQFQAILIFTTIQMREVRMTRYASQTRMRSWQTRETVTIQQKKMRRMPWQTVKMLQDWQRFDIYQLRVSFRNWSGSFFRRIAYSSFSCCYQSSRMFSGLIRGGARNLILLASLLTRNFILKLEMLMFYERRLETQCFLKSLSQWREVEWMGTYELLSGCTFDLIQTLGDFQIIGIFKYFAGIFWIKNQPHLVGRGLQWLICVLIYCLK